MDCCEYIYLTIFNIQYVFLCRCPLHINAMLYAQVPAYRDGAIYQLNRNISSMSYVVCVHLSSDMLKMVQVEVPVVLIPVYNANSEKTGDTPPQDATNLPGL